MTPFMVMNTFTGKKKLTIHANNHDLIAIGTIPILREQRYSVGGVKNKKVLT